MNKKELIRRLGRLQSNADKLSNSCAVLISECQRDLEVQTELVADKKY